MRLVSDPRLRNIERSRLPQRDRWNETVDESLRDVSEFQWNKGFERANHTPIA